MSSPSIMRTQTFQTTPQSKTTLFKVFELSPMTSGKDPLSSSYCHQYNSNKNISQLHSNKKPKTNKVELKPSIMSQQSLRLSEYDSSCNNQSLRISEKIRPPEFITKKTSNNVIRKNTDNANIILVSLNMQPSQKNTEGQPEKKSHKNHLNISAIGVPYRKCHSSMEEKIVNVINKMKNGKQCHRQIETVLQRSKKVSTKQLSNRFFISGIYTLRNLIQNTKLDDKLFAKSQETIRELEGRILDELDSIKAFQIPVEEPKKPSFNKACLIRKAFQILRKKRREASISQLHQKAIQLSSQFLDRQPTDLRLFWDQLRKQ